MNSGGKGEGDKFNILSILSRAYLLTIFSPETKLQRPRIAIRGLNRLSEVYTLLLDAKTQPLKAQNKLTEPKIDSQKPKVDSKRV